MTKKFYKMHGIGNDYIYFDAFGGMPENPSQISIRLSDRHKSIGGDGVIFVTKSGVADGGMRIFNADGSEGKMCGNGVRCVGKFLYEIKGIRKDILRVQTLSGIKTLRLKTKGGTVEELTVDMGKAEFEPKKIPALLEGDKAVGIPLEIDGQEFAVTLVSMGNPHCVTFVSDLDSLDLQGIGKKFEFCELFPERINTEFVKAIAKNEIAMRVWERGSGETLACGTGACAAAVASVLNGYCEIDQDILVHLRGGDLIVRYTNDAVFMTGGAEFAFSGEIEL